jgi:hypothetical protein
MPRDTSNGTIGSNQNSQGNNYQGSSSQQYSQDNMGTTHQNDFTGNRE